MGLNLLLVTADGRPHPTWDDSKHVGDREFIAVGLPAVRTGDPECCLERPIDFEGWRAIASTFDEESGNVGRLVGLVDILEREPEYWLMVSV
jgi:hypothetical protein